MYKSVPSFCRSSSLQDGRVPPSSSVDTALHPHHVSRSLTSISRCTSSLGYSSRSSPLHSLSSLLPYQYPKNFQSALATLCTKAGYASLHHSIALGADLLTCRVLGIPLVLVPAVGQTRTANMLLLCPRAYMMQMRERIVGRYGNTITFAPTLPDPLCVECLHHIRRRISHGRDG